MSTQRPIDLLPREIFERSQAGLRAGRIISWMVVATIIAGGIAAHSRISLLETHQLLTNTEQDANRVLDIEQKTQSFREMRARLLETIRSYNQVAHPVPISGLLATVINEMPASTTVESIELTAGARRNARTPRRRTTQVNEEYVPRVLVGEIAGFSSSDQEIARFVQSLQDRKPFENVGLDFSRTRMLRGKPAREFRMSFRIDLERSYTVLTEPDTMDVAGEVDPAPSAAETNDGAQIVVTVPDAGDES
jgi:hypothetical protein